MTIEELRNSVRQFMRSKDLWREAIGNRPKYFVHLRENGEDLFGLSKFCAAPSDTLSIYVQKGRKELDGGSAQKKIRRVTGMDWTPLEAVKKQYQTSFVEWIKEFFSAYDRDEIHLISLGDSASPPPQILVDELFDEPARSASAVTECSLCDDGTTVANYWGKRFLHGQAHVEAGEAVKVENELGRSAFLRVDLNAPGPAETASDQSSGIREGRERTQQVTRYERCSAARKKCLEHWGYVCVACGFDFVDVYGEIGKGYIHVHHRKPVAQAGGEYILDPVEDLRPVCPNCHAMIHRNGDCMPIAELEELIAEAVGP